MGALFPQDQTESPSRLLVVYEESNSNIDPWVALFKEELKSKKLEADFFAASEAKAKGVSGYEQISIFGSYMAFGMKEPVRDWQEGRPGRRRFQRDQEHEPQ